MKNKVKCPYCGRSDHLRQRDNWIWCLWCERPLFENKQNEK